MPALPVIRRRIRSVRGIHQITKAQQLVAASKLRRVEAAAAAPLAYTAAATELLERLASVPEVRKFPLFSERKLKFGLTIVIAGDRGMAGAYNTNVVRAANAHIRKTAVPQQLITVGRKASVAMARQHNGRQLASYDISADDLDTAIAQPVLHEVVELFESKKVDAVHLVYTAFTSIVRQTVTVSQLLPIVRPQAKADVSEFEPEAEALLAVAARRVLEAQLVQAMLEARASEEAARMVAMMNASDNAGDLIDDLTLLYNSARQASITQELSEISAGAEAIMA